MAGIGNLTQLSQPTLQPSIMGENRMEYIQQPRLSVDTSKADKLAKDVSGLVKGIQNYAKVRHDLSIEATETMARDHLLSTKDEIRQIEANNDMSYAQKREAIASVTKDKLTKSSDFLSDDVELQKIYDKVYTDKARDMLSSSMAQVDKEEDIYNMNVKDNSGKDYLSITPEEADMNGMRSIYREHLKRGLVSESELKAKLMQSKTNHIKNKFVGDMNSVSDKYIDKVFGEYKDDETVNALKSNFKDVRKAEAKKIQTEKDDVFQLSIKERYINDTSFSNIEVLLKEVKSSSDISADTRTTLFNMLSSQKKSIIDSYDKANTKQINQNADTAKYFIETMKIKPNDGVTLNQSAINTLTSNDGEEIMNNNRNNLIAKYGEESTEVLKFDESWRTNRKIAFDIEQGISNNTIDADTHPTAKTMLETYANSTIESYMNQEIKTVQDTKNVAKSLSSMSKVPKAIIGSIYNASASDNPNQLKDTYNNMVLMMNTPDSDVNIKNSVKFKNTQETNALLSLVTTYKNPDGSVNFEKVSEGMKVLLDPNTAKDIDIHKSRITKTMKYKNSYEYSSQSINAITDSVAIKTYLSGDSIEDAGDLLKEELEARSILTDDMSLLDINGHYSKDTMEEFVKVVKSSVAYGIEDSRVKIDVNPSTGGLKATVNGSVLFTTNNKSELEETMAMLSFASKEVALAKEINEAESEAEIVEIENKYSSFMKQNNISYDFNKAKEAVKNTKIKRDIINIGNIISNQFKEASKTNRNFLEKWYRKVGAK